MKPTTLPAIGMLSKKTESKRMVAKFVQEMTKQGTNFATTMTMGGKGEASKISIVPIYFSFTMAMLVIMAQIRSRIKPITPGTKLYSLRLCGL